MNYLKSNLIIVTSLACGRCHLYHFIHPSFGAMPWWYCYICWL